MKHTYEDGTRIGYRAWITHPYGLMSVAIGLDWSSGIQRAACYGKDASGDSAEFCARAPGRTCTCGVYAFDELRRLAAQALAAHLPLVFGEVRCWGRVQSHHFGFRAEFAEIQWISLFDSPHGIAWGNGDHYPKQVAEVGECLGLPVRSLREVLKSMNDHKTYRSLYPEDAWGWELVDPNH